MSRYEQVLRHIRYRNWRPASLESRRFRIKCSELNGRYTSNEFNLEVSAPCGRQGGPGSSILSLVYLEGPPAPGQHPLSLLTQVSLLHEVRVSDNEHVNHLIVQPPFLQSVQHPEARTSVQRSSGTSPGRRDLRTTGNSRPSTKRAFKVQQALLPRPEGGT